MDVAIIGFGTRGQYYAYLFKKRNVNVVAVCDSDLQKLQIAKNKYSVAGDRLFADEKEFFGKGKMADLLVVSTQDADHYGHAVQGLEIGYDLLLEKPIASDLKECIEIRDMSIQLNRKIFVCHVLRYAPFFTSLKKELDSGKFGKVVTINMTENVSYWHQAHSYVRGSWRSAENSTPMIIAKCCHDLDIIVWLTNSDCEYVSSFGDLSYYKRENAPEGSADYCYDCRYIADCPYSADKIYIKDRAEKGRLNWPCNAVVPSPTTETLKAALKRGQYGKCVFKCDNDVVDHQVVNMRFVNGATASLTMTAFGNHSRVIFVHCEKGELYGYLEENKIHCDIFGKEHYTIDTNSSKDVFSGHGGGDERMIEDVINATEGAQSSTLTSIAVSVQSHIIGFNAEKSRLDNGRSIKLSEQ